MSSIVDKRTYLCSLTPPLAKPGRGRFSRAALDALAAAEAAGVVFSDSRTNIVSVPVQAEDGTVTTEQREVDPYAHHADPIREGRLTFVGEGIKLSVNVSEACHHCRYSFGWCYCAVPTFSYWATGEVLTLDSNER